MREVQLGIDLQHGQQIFRSQTFSGCLFEAILERRELLFANTQSARILVAAEFFQQIRASVQSLDHMKAADAPSRSFSVFPLERDDDRGAIATLHNPGGHDPQYAGMPAFASQNNGILVRRNFAAVQLR